MTDDEDDDKTSYSFGMFIGIGKPPEPDFEHAAAAEVDYGPGLDETFETACSMAREIKEEVVTNGPADVPPLCSMVHPTGCYSMPIDEMVDHGIPPPEALGICGQMITKALGPPIAVSLLLETLYRKTEAGEMPEPHVRGEFSRLWMEGKREGLQEALVVVIATRDRYMSRMMPYHYGDGSVIWDPPMAPDQDEEEWLGEEVTGNVAAAIHGIFEEEGEADGTG